MSEGSVSEASTGREATGGAARVPRVSIGIPTWNRADLLRECIASVLAQTETDFELWVFDNASTDHTPEVVASFDDPRIHYVRNPENLGNQPNSTKAMRAGSAEYHVMLFDDDYLLPTCLERKAAVLDAHPEVVCVHSMFEVRNDDGELIRTADSFCGLEHDTIETGADFIETSMLHPARIHISSAMYRRDAVRHEGLFREDYPADDHALWLRIASRGDIAFLAEPLDGLRTTPGVSAANGFHDLTDEGLYAPTLVAARGGRDVKRRFLVTYPATVRQAARLRRLAVAGNRRAIARILQVSVPGFRPLPKAMRMLVEAIRIEPTIVVEPRLLKVLFPRLRTRRRG
ncbi:MAG: glycosyltransferase family 2 protein [Acidimicrobiia bacterium]